MNLVGRGTVPMWECPTIILLIARTRPGRAQFLSKISRNRALPRRNARRGWSLPQSAGRPLGPSPRELAPCPRGSVRDRERGLLDGKTDISRIEYDGRRARRTTG